MKIGRTAEKWCSAWMRRVCTLQANTSQQDLLGFLAGNGRQACQIVIASPPLPYHMASCAGMCAYSAFAMDDFISRAPGRYHLDIHSDTMRETCRIWGGYGAQAIAD